MKTIAKILEALEAKDNTLDENLLLRVVMAMGAGSFSKRSQGGFRFKIHDRLLAIVGNVKKRVQLESIAVQDIFFNCSLAGSTDPPLLALPRAIETKLFGDFANDSERFREYWRQQGATPEIRLKLVNFWPKRIVKIAKRILDGTFSAEDANKLAKLFEKKLKREFILTLPSDGVRGHAQLQQKWDQKFRSIMRPYLEDEKKKSKSIVEIDGVLNCLPPVVGKFESSSNADDDDDGRKYVAGRFYFVQTIKGNIVKMFGELEDLREIIGFVISFVNIGSNGTNYAMQIEATQFLVAYEFKQANESAESVGVSSEFRRSQ